MIRSHELSTNLRIAQLRFLLRQWQLADIAPHRQLVKRGDCFKGQQNAQCAAVRLHEHLAASGNGLVRECIVVTPVVRRFTVTEHAEGDRHVRIKSECFQTAEKFLNAFWSETSIFPGDFENARAQLSHDAN